MIRILLLDEQQLVIEGLKMLLESESDLKVVGSYSDSQTALSSIKYIDLDIVIISKKLAESDNFFIVKSIQQQCTNSKIIILSDRVDEYNFVRSLELGVEGYILDNISVYDIKDVIRYVNKGFTHIGHTVLETIVLPKLSESCSSMTVKDLAPEKSLAAKELLENRFQFRSFPQNYHSHNFLFNCDLAPENSLAPTETEKARGNSWRKKVLYRLALASLGLSAIALGLFSVQYRRGSEVVINDAIINGELIAINSPAEGTLKEVIYTQSKYIEANQIFAEIEPLKDNNAEKMIAQLEEDINLKQKQIDNAKNYLSFLKTSLATLQQESKATVIVATGKTNNILDESLDYTFVNRNKINNAHEVANLEQQIINQEVTVNLFEKELNNLQEKFIDIKSKIITRKTITINAPISGKIHNVNYSSGELITSSEEIATIVDCQSLWVEAVIDSNIAAQINLQEDVLVQLVDRESLIPGKITLIASLDDSNQINSDNSVSSLAPIVPINSSNELLSRIIVSIDFSNLEFTEKDFCNLGLSAKISLNN